MPFYHKLGKIPHKRHTQFKRGKTGELYYEQLFGTEGFAGVSSLLYHLHRPTQIKEIGKSYDVAPKIAVKNNIRPRMLHALEAVPADDFLESRRPLLVNEDVSIGVAAPQKTMSGYFYKNSDADELLFVHHGSGTLRTFLGSVVFAPGDYLVIPRGMIYRIEFTGSDNRMLCLESYHPIYPPHCYRNEFGQLLEHSPYCERDIKLPKNLETHDAKGNF